jgi:hypothetical protein
MDRFPSLAFVTRLVLPDCKVHSAAIEPEPPGARQLKGERLAMLPPSAPVSRALKCIAATCRRELEGGGSANQWLACSISVNVPRIHVSCAAILATTDAYGATFQAFVGRGIPNWSARSRSGWIILLVLLIHGSSSVGTHAVLVESVMRPGLVGMVSATLTILNLKSRPLWPRCVFLKRVTLLVPGRHPLLAPNKQAMTVTWIC